MRLKRKDSNMKRYYLITFSFLIIMIFNCERNNNILDSNEPFISNNFEILYISDGNIFVMDSVGSNKKNLTSDLDGPQFDPQISYDGSKIVFTNFIPDTVNYNHAYTTYIMDNNGHNKVNLGNTSLRPFHPKLSPDGSYIVFDATENVDDIYIMNSDGTNLKNLTNDKDRDWLPQFTPDGTKIIYRSEKDNNMDIYSINFNGTNKTNLSHDGKLWGTDYCISSDGLKIVYTSCKDGQSNIYIMNIDGTHQIKITNSFGNENPTFSYDGLRIAYISWSISGYDIKIIDIDGKNERTITSTKRPPQNDYWRTVALFTPDGEHLVFTSFNDGNNEIYIVDVYGENLKNLTNNLSEDVLACVLPIN